MGKRKENEPRVYIIPKNFLDSGYVFGGRFKQRNFIEAAALTAPVFGIFLYGWKVVGWDVGSTVAACIILCTGVFMAAVAGRGGGRCPAFSFAGKNWGVVLRPSPL